MSRQRRVTGEISPFCLRSSSAVDISGSNIIASHDFFWLILQWCRMASLEGADIGAGSKISFEASNEHVIHTNIVFI
jgi:hypothetical protein